MFDKWLKLPAHYYLKITALVILTVGICLHNTLMSIGAIWIMANWLIEADFKNYWKKFKSSPSIWMLLGILLFGLLSLLWSEDVAYGLKDLGRKMPFFAIPFALGLGKPLEKKIVFFILYIFIGIVVLTSAINYYRFHYVLENPLDIREMSYFISHVRFSILTVLGIFISIYLIASRKGPSWLWAIAIAWLTYYTLKAQILNGYLVLFVLIGYTLFYMVRKIPTLKWKAATSTFIVLLGLGFLWMLNSAVSSYHKPCDMTLEELDSHTVNGRPYFHDLASTQRENGHLVWVYVQQEELENEWNKRSKIDYHGTDELGQPMFGTLFRYMTSKDLRKDSVGVWQLSEEDIAMIESGKTSANPEGGMKAKLHDFLYQWDLYQQGGDPNGHSLLQRIEHQRVAWSIIREKGILGVGIGDVPTAFGEAYTAADSQLEEGNRLRSHNQFLTIWISHGILGLLMFLGMFVLPFVKRKQKDYFFYAVLLTLFASCLFQDMIETQAGVTIFGLFYGLTVYKEDQAKSSESESKESE